MKIVEVIRTTEIPAEIIWDEMKHFDRVLRWVPGGDKCTISVKGKGIGAINKNIWTTIFLYKIIKFYIYFF